MGTKRISSKTKSLQRDQKRETQLARKKLDAARTALRERLGVIDTLDTSIFSHMVDTAIKKSKTQLGVITKTDIPLLMDLAKRELRMEVAFRTPEEHGFESESKYKLPKQTARSHAEFFGQERTKSEPSRISKTLWAGSPCSF